MSWRGPEYKGEFPTLGYLVADWIEELCVIPDGDDRGKPFQLPDEQLNFILWHYRLKPDATGKGKPRTAFHFRRSQLTRSQKWGKGPLSASIICAEAAGPVIFDGWDAYGEPVGRPWSTPLIQTAAASEDQTDNVWSALQPMIELGPLADIIPDTGLGRINLPGGGKIEPVTSAAISRLGARITFALHDETHSWFKENGGVKLADAQRRNLAGMGGRCIETTNAWDPSEESVAQQTFESAAKDIFKDYPEPLKGNFKVKAERRKILRHAYKGAPWVDLDGIEAECAELMPRDPNQAERFFGNRIVAGADTAFDVDLFKTLADAHEVERDRIITLGFDGSKRLDSTGLVATDVETGYQWVVGVWERPEGVTGEDWEVPASEVTAAVREAFDKWDVWRLYGDPPYWTTEMDEWAGEHGEEKVVKWWTNRYKAMAYAIKAWVTDWAGETPALSHDGHEALVRHVGNAVKNNTRMRDDDGSFLWYIKKDGAKSPRKIDLAMCAVLSWTARSDAIAAGVLNKKKYKRASW